jgi:hypothetical protein
MAEPKRRSASVLKGEVRQVVEQLIEEGRSVPEKVWASAAGTRPATYPKHG